MNMVFEEFSNGSATKWDGKGSKWLWLEKNLRGTERLLIIDDAELLFVSAFRWAFSLHDATGLPMAFIGNDEVIDKIRRADRSGKMISRIGIVHHARMKDDAEESARKLILQFAPDSKDELLEEVTRTICGAGHSRRARKQMVLAVNIREGARDKDWAKAYALAGTKLISSTTRGSK
jgi:DNA transposition AAA+ family ATPase